MSSALRYLICLALPALIAAGAVAASADAATALAAAIAAMVLAVVGSWLTQRAGPKTTDFLRAAMLSLMIRLCGGLVAAVAFALVDREHAALASAIIGGSLAAAIITEALSLLLHEEPNHA